MTDAADTARLMALVKAALEEADQQDNTLVAALLSECIEAIERRRR